MTRLDLTRSDGGLSAERHIKRLCHRSAAGLYAKPRRAFTQGRPSEVSQVSEVGQVKSFFFFFASIF